MDAFELQLKDALARRQAGQQAAQSFQMPQGRMVSGYYIPPSLGDAVVQGLRTYTGQKQFDEAGQEIEQLSQKRQQALSQALRQFGQQAMGTPAETLPEGVEGPTRPGVAPNMRGAYSALLEAPDAALRQAGVQGLAQIPQMEMRQAERQEDRAFREQQAQAQRDMQLQLAQMRAEAGQQGRGDYFVPVQTSEGIRILNSRTGQLAMPQGTGGPLMPPSADPRLQGELATAKTQATETAKRNVEARFEAPEAIAKGEEALRLVDDLLSAPGFKQAVGASRMLGVQRIPGTSARDFDIRLDQLKGQQFLQAFESLKGGGQITEVEGRKATDAISRMNADASEAEFTKAAREFQDIIRRGLERARQRGGVQNAPAAQPAAPTAPRRLRFDAQGNVIP